MNVYQSFSKNLPSNIATKAINYAKQRGTLNNSSKGIRNDLIASFLWKNTVEGHDFWLKVYDSIKEQTSLRKKLSPGRNTHIARYHCGDHISFSLEDVKKISDQSGVPVTDEKGSLVYKPKV